MIAPAFVEVLAAGRSGFNLRTREAQRRHPGFSSEVFRAFLEEGVGPIVDAVAAADRSRVPAVVLAAYDIALELAGRALVGPAARGTAVEETWRGLLPHYARLVAAQPERVLGMLTNAVVHLDALPGVRRAQWLHEMAALAPRVASVDELRIVGQVQAWRAGAAHFRAGAIAAADGLPEALALAAFGAPANASWPALRGSIAADPWWAGADAYAAREREIGAFSGFGGPFAAPPEVRATSGGFVVRAGERHWFLAADAYGAVLHAAAADEFDQAAPARCAHRVEGTMLHVGAQAIALDLPEAGLAVCANDTTYALTSSYTHAIRLLPREPR